MLAVWAYQTEDVLWEQIDYLMAHGGSGCVLGEAGCEDCWRLARMIETLLIPFRVDHYEMSDRRNGGNSSNRAASE